MFRTKMVFMVLVLLGLFCVQAFGETVTLTVGKNTQDEDKLNDQSVGAGKLGIFMAPRHKVTLTNRFYLDDKTTLNTQLFWSDTYINRAPTPARVDPYFRLDIRLAKRIWDDNAELAFGVTNLQDGTHFEGSNNGSEVPRIVYFQFFYKF